MVKTAYIPLSLLMEDGMRCFALICLISTVQVAAQGLDPNIILQGSKMSSEQAQESPILRGMEQAARIKLLQQQAAMLQAQREQMQTQSLGTDYKIGFEAGMKAGYQAGVDAYANQFNADRATYERSVMTKFADSIFKDNNLAELQGFLEGLGPGLPGDNLTKSLKILVRARIAELTPPTSHAFKKAGRKK